MIKWICKCCGEENYKRNPNCTSCGMLEGKSTKKGIIVNALRKAENGE